MSVADQETAFATGVLHDIYTFHRYTMNSISLCRTKIPSIEGSSAVKLQDFTIDLGTHLHALYTQ